MLTNAKQKSNATTRRKLISLSLFFYILFSLTAARHSRGTGIDKLFTPRNVNFTVTYAKIERNIFAGNIYFLGTLKKKMRLSPWHLISLSFQWAFVTDPYDFDFESFSNEHFWKYWHKFHHEIFLINLITFWYFRTFIFHLSDNIIHV